MDTDDARIEELLGELEDARAWPDRLEALLENGENIDLKTREADKRIENLEGRAKGVMKNLGCVRPETRRVYQAMADMLISWQTFKDRLP